MLCCAFMQNNVLLSSMDCIHISATCWCLKSCTTYIFKYAYMTRTNNKDPDVLWSTIKARPDTTVLGVNVCVTVWPLPHPCLQTCVSLAYLWLSFFHPCNYFLSLFSLLLPCSFSFSLITEFCSHFSGSLSNNVSLCSFFTWFPLFSPLSWQHSFFYFTVSLCLFKSSVERKTAPWWWTETWAVR